MNIRNVCIVGGGSSGWMTASILSKHAPWLNITLIESERVGTIGVGESTIGQINVFMRMLELKDEDWMAECNATYKASIKFTDFREKGSVFHYPFGQYDFGDNSGLMSWNVLNTLRDDMPPETFARFFHQSYEMIDRNKITTDKKLIPGFNPDRDLAYHMDAGLFGEFLRKRFCHNVNHIVDDVVAVAQGEDGIEAVHTQNNGEFEADLFIDCTGFKSLLLEGALNEPFISFKDTVTNDFAIATHIPYIDKETEMEVTTNCTALSSGWVWNIPLYNHIGTGYVYNSDFISHEDAEAEFRAHLGERGVDAELKCIYIKNGIHERAWVKNCVAVGLSNGFIEPLESTGLMLTHETILYLIRTLVQRKGRVTSFMRDSFNFAVRDTMEGFRQFIALHYGLSPREDTPYWDYVTNHVEYDKPMAYYLGADNPRQNTNLDMAYRMNISVEVTDNLGGLPYIVAGMGLNPAGELEKLVQGFNEEEVKGNLDFMYDKYMEKQAAMKAVADELPSHYQYLKENIYGGEG